MERRGMGQITKIMALEENKIIFICDEHTETLQGLDYPEGVTHIDCTNKGLKSLIGCPPTVTHLDCANNKLKSLEGCPPSVIWLSCKNNQLESLEGCSPNVQWLHCKNNHLENFKWCPPAVKYIDCELNHIKSWEGFTGTNIYEVNLMRNRMEDLRGIPQSIITLHLGNNPLKSLETDRPLPNLNVLTLWNKHVSGTDILANLKGLPSTIQCLGLDYREDKSYLAYCPNNVTLSLCHDNYYHESENYHHLANKIEAQRLIRETIRNKAISSVHNKWNEWWLHPISAIQMDENGTEVHTQHSRYITKMLQGYDDIFSN